MEKENIQQMLEYLKKCDSLDDSNLNRIGIILNVYNKIGVVSRSDRKFVAELYRRLINRNSTQDHPPGADHPNDDWKSKAQEWEQKAEEWRSKAYAAMKRAKTAERALESLKKEQPHAVVDKIKVVKSNFAKLYHPDNSKHDGIEKMIRAEVFKEFWEILDRIEKS